jgi:hypothetical protein
MHQRERMLDMELLRATVNATVPPTVPNMKRKLRFHHRALDMVKRKLDYCDRPLEAGIPQRRCLTSRAQNGHIVFFRSVPCALPR